MSSGPANFKLQMSFRRAVDDGPVFQKQDGERFDSTITVKMNVSTRYSIVLTTRPAKTISRVLFKGEKLTLERQKPEDGDDAACVYHTEWTTVGMEVSKANLRSYVPISVEMEDGASVQTKMQIKLYPTTEYTHSKWGQEFHMLDLDCTQKSGLSAIEVRKEQFI